MLERDRVIILFPFNVAGSKPFRCPVCDQRFRTSGHRKAHLMSHVKEVTNRDSQFRIRQIIVDSSQQITQQTTDADQLQEQEEEDQIEVQQPQEQTEIQDEIVTKPLSSVCGNVYTYIFLIIKP